MRILRFKSWNARRKFAKNRKIIKNLQRPTLPEGTNLIKFPILSNDQNVSSRSRKQWILNPNGKSFVCILHEYVQHALKKQPTYEFKELENAATPYSATVCVNGVKYGTGYGTSKKQAKAEAAKETLEILIPDMKEKIPGLKPDKNAIKPNYKDLSVFDDIKITDARVAEFCNKTTEPPPHQILLTCLSRNFGLGDVDINYDIETTRNKKNKFTLTVGKHKATVYCKNKREGKQLASQEILQVRWLYQFRVSFAICFFPSTATSSTHQLLGIFVEVIWKPLNKDLQGEEARGTGNHSITEQSYHQPAEHSYPGQTAD